MSTLQDASTSLSRAVTPARVSVPLVDSINDLPFRARDGESYVVSAKAMDEIIDELRKLWHMRESLADVLAKKDKTG